MILVAEMGSSSTYSAAGVMSAGGWSLADDMQSVQHPRAAHILCKHRVLEYDSLQGAFIDPLLNALIIGGILWMGTKTGSGTERL